MSQKSLMRRFVLVREEDVHGTSGIGVVAEGVVFTNGQVAFTWISPFHSVTVVPSVDILEKIHGHEGRTRVEYIDESLNRKPVTEPTTQAETETEPAARPEPDPVRTKLLFTCPPEYCLLCNGSIDCNCACHEE